METKAKVRKKVSSLVTWYHSVLIVTEPTSFPNEPDYEICQTYFASKCFSPNSSNLKNTYFLLREKSFALIELLRTSCQVLSARKSTLNTHWIQWVISCIPQNLDLRNCSQILLSCLFLSIALLLCCLYTENFTLPAFSFSDHLPLLVTEQIVDSSISCSLTLQM